MLLSLEHFLSASVAEQRASKPIAVTLTSTAEAIKIYGLRQTPVETEASKFEIVRSVIIGFGSVQFLYKFYKVRVRSVL